MTAPTRQKPQKWPITLTANDNWPPDWFDIVDSSNVAISTFTSVRMQIKRSPLESTFVKELTLGNGFIKLGSRVTFDDTKKVDMRPGTYVYDIEVTVNGKNYTIWADNLKVDHDVTRVVTS